MKDDVLEWYTGVFEHMLERYTTGKQRMYDPSYIEQLQATLTRLNAEYERRTT